MPKQPFTNIYDLDYFCLTDDNTLLVKRSGKFMQIKPSEFLDGDLLPSLDEQNNLVWCRSSRTSRTVKKDDKIVRLVSQRGTFYLTVGHKMFLEDGRLEAAGNIKPGDKLRYSSCFRLSEESPIGIDKAYVLGAYAAEGSSQEGVGIHGTGKWRLVWGLHLNEDIFATKILVYAISAFPGSHCQIDIWPEYTRRTVSCYDKNLVQIFKDLGALGLCYDKRVPSCIFSATKYEKAAYIAALIEGDGTWNDRRITLTLTGKALIDGLHLLLEDIGINSKLTYSDATEGNEEKYSLSIYGKNNLRLLLSFCSNYWFGWKHLSNVQEYAESINGNIKHSSKDIEEALRALYPISGTNFSLHSNIPQAAIKRIFGSWNLCLQHFGYPIKNTRWGTSHEPIKKPVDYDHGNGFDYASNMVIRVDFLTLNEDIFVYDFSVPKTNNFLLNTICSHNSSSQCFIYIGDVLVDEVTSIQYRITQDKQPIYGYASQLFDDTSKGHVLVTGAFTINFKEQGYLWAVLRRFKQLSLEESGVTVAQIKDKKKQKEWAAYDRRLNTNLFGGPDNPRPIIGSNGTIVQRASIERIVSGNVTRQERYDFYNDLAGYATFDVDSPKDKTFEDIVEAFEDQVWTQPDNTLDSQIRRTDHNAFDDFDLYVVLGNYDEPRCNHSVQKLIGVRLTSQGKSISIDDLPIQEEYTFLARSAA